MKRKYIIIPGCSDLNRGDQALVWETKRIAEESGFEGEFYLTSEKNEPVYQSKEKGIQIIEPLLEHPSRKFKNKENINYTKMLKVKWGIVSILDFLISFLLLFKIFRIIIKAFLSDEKKKTIELFENADAIFMKGGGLLQTYGGLSSTYSMYFWVYPIIFSNKLKKDVYIMPNSFGPFQGPFVKSIAKYALKKCKLVTSRETLSQKMVHEQLNLKINNYPDLAFTLPMSKIDKKEFLKKYNISSDKKIVAITMRPYRFPKSNNPEKAYNDFKKEMRDFIIWLNSKNYIPLIIEHTLAVNAHENDGACIRDVISSLDSNQYIFFTEEKYNCYDLKTIYSFCDYIVGTRFHSMIFSFGSNVPGIAIAYTGNKSQGIMHDMDLDEYVIEIYDVTSEKLKEKFNKLINEESIVRNKISKYLDNCVEYRRKLINNIKGDSNECV